MPDAGRADHPHTFSVRVPLDPVRLLALRSAVQRGVSCEPDNRSRPLPMEDDITRLLIPMPGDVQVSVGFGSAADCEPIATVHLNIQKRHRAPRSSKRCRHAPSSEHASILLAPADRRAPFVQKLRTRDDRFDQTAERVIVGRQPCPHLVERLLVRRQQAAPQGVGKQLPAQVIDEIVLPFVAQISRRPGEPVAVLAVGEGRGGFDRRPPRSLVRRSPIGPKSSKTRPIESKRRWQPAQLLLSRCRASTCGSVSSPRFASSFGNSGTVGGGGGICSPSSRRTTQ